MARYTKTGTFTDISQIDAELEKVQESMKDLLSREGESPNSMNSSLDMNSNRLLNLPYPVSPLEPLRLGDLPASTKGEKGDTGDAGTGSVNWYNVQDYGADPTGVERTDEAVQAAIDAAQAAGGGTVYFPQGTYLKSNYRPDGITKSAQWKVTGDNITIRGEGDSSVIKFNDEDNGIRSDLIYITGSHIILKDFKVLGTGYEYVVDTDYSQAISGKGVLGLRIENVTVEAVQNMSIVFEETEDVIVTGCSLLNCARDGYRFTGGRNVRIIGNYAKNVADDVVACHSLDGTQTIENIIVTNNIFEGCQSMKFLGAKDLTIANNIMRRSIRSCIYIADDASTEGNTNMGNINIHDNTFLDCFTGFGTNNIIYIKGSNIVGTGTGVAGFDEAEFPYNQNNDIDDLGTALMPIQNLNIKNNTFARTLDNVANYTSYGYGQFFDRVDAGLSQVTVSYFRDQAITDSNFLVYPITLDCPVQEAVIDGNTFKGYGLNALRIYARDFNLPLAYQSLRITNNSFRDMGSGASSIINFIDSTPNGSNLHPIIEGNTFNGDPYFRHSGHNADNTWTASTDLEAIYWGSVTFIKGAMVQGNTFENVSGTGVRASKNVRTGTPNIVYSDYIDLDDAANKGVRQLPLARDNLIVKIDGDPASSTFRQVTHYPETTQTASNFPLTGHWAYGHFIKNRDPSTINDPSTGTYIVLGWIKTDTNSTGSIGTPAGFGEMRCFISNIT